MTELSHAAGKSTASGRLIFDLGGIPARELEKLKETAAEAGKPSSAFAFYMDRVRELYIWQAC